MDKYLLPIGHVYNQVYKGAHLNRVAFPIGGIGAGMFCLEGTGAISHMSVRNHMEFYHEPLVTYAGICVKGAKNVARVLEGPVPDWKFFGPPNSGNGGPGATYGLPRFKKAVFEARFPFAKIRLEDPAVALETEITGWSPFIPGDADNSSLPVGALEYSFTNPGATPVEALFSFNMKNFMAIPEGKDSIRAFPSGFLLWQDADTLPENKRGFAVFVHGTDAIVDHTWFRGAWFDAPTSAWRNLQQATPVSNPPVEGPTMGATVSVPFTVAPGSTYTVRVLTAWHVPNTKLQVGQEPAPAAGQQSCADPASCGCDAKKPGAQKFYQPWYAGRFGNIEAVGKYWRDSYEELREKSLRFSDAFYDSTLPPEVIEAVAANLTILKSPTVLRQTDGRLWCFEGCGDAVGCCHGSCTHVWNYAQAIAHLFPTLERSLRQTEFEECFHPDGRQSFRSNLPITPGGIGGEASDGQLGGIMKMYREWRISGDTAWLRRYWPRIRQSLDYIVSTLDPRETGMLEECHHNTYDINYYGPDGHTGSFYLGALMAAIRMGESLGEDTARYKELLSRGVRRLENELYNGEYFYQKIMTDGLSRPPAPLKADESGPGYRQLVELLNEQGTKYQYGTGCLSDGILGLWIARMCGLDDPIADVAKVRSHLKSVHRYNLKADLSEHVNPQRPTYAMGNDGGLLLCTWPHGGALAFPFVYSDEVWTGIEYQVASHLMMEGMVDEGLEIVRVCRDRYDGVRRNPFNEYECGHWYARAMSSYGLLQGLTGLRYDAVERTLHIDSKVGDFRCFLATATGYGVAGLKNGSPFVEVRSGSIDITNYIVSGKKIPSTT